jgi:hypothetical protein
MMLEVFANAQARSLKLFFFGACFRSQLSLSSSSRASRAPVKRLSATLRQSESAATMIEVVDSTQSISSQELKTAADS